MGKRTIVLAIGVILALVMGVQVAAFASHPLVTLDGSNFEIDEDANLKVDHDGDPDPLMEDWASVGPANSAADGEVRKPDKASGAGDDSFGQGTKEDTRVPTVVNGSIPPNKSDLFTFGVYLETYDDGDPATPDRFLNVFWHRVQEPSGTTNMDFEFNQSETLTANGVTPVRTAGDLLIQYDLASGGTHPELFLSEWVATGNKSLCEAANSTPCWGDRINLSAAGDATGSINTSEIPVAESDGLATTETGPISPRTFGEAQIDFDALQLEGDACTSFGSAYLKSRSSDAFTAAMKDFIAPASLNLNECGAIEITKTRKHAASGAGDHPHAGVLFTLDDNDPATTDDPTATTDADGKACVDGLALGSSYNVKETVPTGYQSEDSEQTVTVDTAATCEDDPYVGETVSFHNTPLTDITVSVNSQVTGGTASNISCTGLTPTPADGTPAANDDTSETVKDLLPGTYTCTVVVDP